MHFIKFFVLQYALHVYKCHFSLFDEMVIFLPFFNVVWNWSFDKLFGSKCFDQLIKSSLFGEVDKLLGVSSNIMMGQKIKAGTNNCELLFDENKYIEEISKISDVPEDINIMNQDIDSMFEDDKDEETYEYCNDDDFKFSIE